MKFRNWKESIEVVGFIAIVASLIFVGIELKQSRSIAIGEGNLANAEIQIETNNAINEYATVWVRGNTGEELVGHDAVIFHNLVKNKAIHAFMEYARLGQLEFDEATEEINAQFSIFLFENPGARQVWNLNEEFLKQNSELSVAHQAWKDSVHANLIRLDGKNAR